MSAQGLPRHRVASRCGRRSVPTRSSITTPAVLIRFRFDLNLNVYAQAEEECFSGLLTFDADLNAIPDWAETFTLKRGRHRSGRSTSGPTTRAGPTEPRRGP